MSLSSRVQDFAQLVASYFRITTVDLSSSIDSRLSGSITIRRVGPIFGYLSYSIGGTAIGAPSSETVIAQLPAGNRPAAVTSGVGRTSQSGQGFSLASVQLNRSGTLTIAGQRLGDSTVAGTMFYLLG